MTNGRKYLFFLSLPFFCIACNNNSEQKQTSKDSSITVNHSYAYDADFLTKHTSQLVELQNPEGTAKVLISSDYQGRVMTSTALGDSGTSYGWINYGLIASGEKKKQ